MFSNLFLILIAILSMFIVLWYKRNLNYWLRYKTLPSVAGSVISGNLWDFIRLKTNLGFELKTMYDNPKFANEAAVGFYSLLRPALLIRDPDLLKSIFIKDFDCFTNRFARPSARKDRIGSLMLLFAKKSYWKDMRSKLSPFFSSSKLRQMFPLIQRAGENLDGHLKRKGKRFVVEVKDICTLFTIEVSSVTLFGLTTNSLENPKDPFCVETKRISQFSLERAFHFMCIFFFPDLCDLLGIRFFSKSTEEFLKSAIDQVMEFREKSEEKRNDLIDIFLKLKQEAKANGNNMDDFMNDVYAQAFQFLIGGFATSSSAIAHGLLELAKHTEIQERLRSEILEAFSQGKGEIDFDSIEKLEYLDMVVHEVMRKYPLFPFLERKYEKPAARPAHYSLQPFYDATLPEGIPIYISVFGLHYDEKYWPNPTKFDPERFAPGNRAQIHPMVYIPVGAGQRNCIGARLGMIQVKMGLIHFLKNHFVQVCAQTPTDPVFDPKAVVVEIKDGIYLEAVADYMCDSRLSKSLTQ